LQCRAAAARSGLAAVPMISAARGRCPAARAGVGAVFRRSLALAGAASGGCRWLYLQINHFRQNDNLMF